MSDYTDKLRSAIGLVAAFEREPNDDLTTTDEAARILGDWIAEHYLLVGRKPPEVFELVMSLINVVGIVGAIAARSSDRFADRADVLRSALDVIEAYDRIDGR